MRALLSVWDKTGIVDLARRLAASGIEVISTGGTYQTIAAAGVPVTSVEEVTNFPEMIGGRVKTLHPAIHGGILARRDLPNDLEQIENHGIKPIDLVVGNLYPFQRVVRDRPDDLANALEHIDIGGPAMIRAAAKNFPSVIVVVDPADYDVVAAGIEARGFDGIPLELRRTLAAKAFSHVAAYDSVIASYLESAAKLPEQVVFAAEKVADLRYGENPHQSAAFYRLLTPLPDFGAAGWRQHGGKEMSYNNYLDAQAAVWIVEEFEAPSTAIVKHNGPCGVASADDLHIAYERALNADPVSAFGGIAAMNVVVDVPTARRIAEHYFEVIVGPGYHPEAMEILRKKKNLRIIEAPDTKFRDELEIRALDGSILVQQRDRVPQRSADWRIVSERRPTDDEIRDLTFAWRVVRHVKSNAIVLAQLNATVGIGGGQPNRVDAVRIAVERAGTRAAGSVLASDAFFPFADGLEEATRAGVTAVAQPGGSVRDAEVIEAANAAGIAMVFTGIRHFRH